VGGYLKAISELLKYKFLDYFKERPITYLDKIVYFLLNKYSITIDKTII